MVAKRRPNEHEFYVVSRSSVALQVKRLRADPAVTFSRPALGENLPNQQRGVIAHNLA